MSAFRSRVPGSAGGRFRAAFLALMAGAAHPTHAAVVARDAARAAPSACSRYKAGLDHVVRTFCSGAAVAHITIDGRDHVLRGGSCESLSTVVSLNLGVVTEPDATIFPDYVGLTAPRAGPFTNAALAVRVDGVRYRVMRNSGVASPRGGSFQGTGNPVSPAGPPVRVTGSYTC